MLGHRVLVFASIFALGCNSGSRSRGPNNNDGSDGGTPAMQAMQNVIAPGAPPDAPNQFGGPSSPQAAPQIVYPPDGVLMPANIDMLEVQFIPAQGTNLFEIDFVSPTLALSVYTPCTSVGPGCSYLPDEQTWKLISDNGRGATTKISIRATTLGGGAPVGASGTQSMLFTDEDLQGGLYYWAAASGGIYRYDFGLRGQTAETFYTPAQAGGGTMCVGCHALSHDGTRIAVGLNVPGPATLRVLDVATRATLYESASSIFGGTGGSNFEALSPDASTVIAQSGNDLALFDAQSGAAIGSGPAIANGTMPDWSADGKSIVFARSAMAAPCIMGLCTSQPGVDGASLFLASVSGSTVGAPTQLVTGGGNNYYPSFSPDGQWVAFNRSAQNSYDAPDARVMVAGTQGSAPIDLATVNGTLGNSWPKFAPFVQHFGGRTIFWITFSSRRDYGIRLQNSTSSMPTAQLWMVGFSPDSNETGPTSYPPFWLPFQDITTGNHIAQWTQTVVRQPCDSGSPDPGCMPGEICMNDQCVPKPIM